MNNIKTRKIFEEEGKVPQRPYKVEDVPYFKEESKKLMKGVTKFTFKTDKPTGRYRSFYSNSYHVKIKGVDVGSIEAPENEGGKWQIRLKVVKDDPASDKNTNCSWKWITLKNEYDSLEATQQWLNDHFKAITEKWQLSME